MEKLTKITMVGNLSKKEMIINIEVVVALVNAYMTVIPNEKRSLPESLKVLRFHDDLAKVLIAEEEAAMSHIEKRTKDILAEELE